MKTLEITRYLESKTSDENSPERDTDKIKAIVLHKAIFAKSDLAKRVLAELETFGYIAIYNA